MGGGSTVMQFLYQGYHTNLAQVVTGYATNLLAAIALTMNGAVMLYIIIFGHRMMFGNLTGGEAVTKASRLIVVAALMGAANYQTFIATPVTQTIPDFISNTITGANGVTGAQGFDALINQVQNFSAHARSQMIGFAYIGDRVATWALEGLAGLFLLICFVVWSLANATADILVPLGAILLPFYLFDATRSYAERWYGKIMSLFLVMIVMLMVGQIVVFQDAQYMQRFEMAIAAAPPDNGFNMNPGLETGALFQPAAGSGAQAGPTINTDGAIDTLIDISLVFAYGLALLYIAARVALHIGGASGFSAAPVFNAMSAGAGRLIGRR